MSKKLLTLFLFCVCFFSIANATDENSLREEAEQGDADAQFVLGKNYYEGFFFRKSYLKAAKWLELAAEQGHNQAQYMVVPDVKTKIRKS